MPLPFLLSVPHAGQQVPPEVQNLCILRKEDIIDDMDKGAGEIYLPLKKDVAALVQTGVARAIVDMNRGEDDRSKDGIIKSHTCWDVPVYSESLPKEIVNLLIKRYYRPYHENLSRFSQRGIMLGIDCHTMAEFGPPVGPDPGAKRPRICLSNGEGTCPAEWIEFLADCLEETIGSKVKINKPFKGGYIIKLHARELPWVQLELSREIFFSNEEKKDRLLRALKAWCKRIS